jgi:glycosyltransferase involved in cell wall biosynthesis
VVVTGQDQAAASAAARRGLRGWLPKDIAVAMTFRHVLDNLVRDVMQFRPDVVHLHSIHLPANVSLAKHLRREKVPYCVTVHGGLFGRQRGRIKKSIFWWLSERAYLDDALFVHALTEHEAADLKSCGIKSDVVVVPNGIDLSSLPRARNRNALVERLPELAGKRIFLYMGRLDPVQKGLDLLIQAFARADIGSSRLVLLGPDSKDGRAGLRKMITQLGLESRVTMLDEEGPERCADLLAGAEVFVHSSRWEGVSLAVLEAAAWERACLLTHAADPMGAIGAAGGAVVVAATVEGLTEGIRRLARADRDHLADMGRRAAVVVERTFQWSSAASALVNAYRRSGDCCRQA